MRILVGEHSGFCFGVRRAVQIAENAAGHGTVYTYGNIIHNEDVVDALKQKGVLPELVFFDDDFLAMGALAAMLHAGVRIPEDVGFVALANRFGGSGMAFAVPITRMEVDSHADGRILSDAVLSYLGNGDFPSGIIVGPKYVKGGTLKHKRKGSCL